MISADVQLHLHREIVSGIVDRIEDSPYNKQNQKDNTANQEFVRRKGLIQQFQEDSQHNTEHAHMQDRIYT